MEEDQDTGNSNNFGRGLAVAGCLCGVFYSAVAMTAAVFDNTIVTYGGGIAASFCGLMSAAGSISTVPVARKAYEIKKQREYLDRLHKPRP